ncbi:hypothetical protein AH04_200 [Erwinia phage AH04]|uniref:Uncharacterized protein n=1 Tax=Erwinia phage AH04 TaxID=2869569 RepID=A0AAE7X110_9CAUD|nr:hypothetical protein PQC02_gp114 [Erwinia phage AH04]QZA70675.1 hypothetical protein AH04_200 [Erwinia phage AH04]
MAHYFDIHLIDKNLVQGILVISFTENSSFEEKMFPVLQIVRCGFNEVFRRYFNVNSEWDTSYFVVKAGYIRFLIKELKTELAKGDDGEIYDLDNYNKVLACLTELSKNPDEDATYLLSWEK